jgi:hypothetical protein
MYCLRIRFRLRLASMLSMLLTVGFTVCSAQSPSTGATTGSAVYLTPSDVPSPLRRPLVVLGDRLQTPGKERLILNGTYADNNGNQNIRITWELPGKIRIDLTGTSTHTLIFDGTSATSNASSSDNDLLESLGDDRAETLLYEVYTSGFAWRFLGGWFRTDDGTTVNYTGPFYHIHQTGSNTRVRSDQAARHKFYCFDSNSALLTQVLYLVNNNGAPVHVQTGITGWSTVSGQAIPGQIVRSENGAVVWTIQIASGQVSATANDGLFSNP